MIANLRSEHIQNLGGQIGAILDNLDFQANGALLGGFSFGALDAIFGDGEVTLGGPDAPGKIADLANSVGGGQIFHLDSAKLEEIVGSVDPGDFAGFNPNALSGMFAGLGHNQIVGFDSDRIAAAIEAVGADFLGGTGSFDGIAGGNTAFDQLARFQDLETALDGFEGAALDIFSGNLFAHDAG